MTLTKLYVIEITHKRLYYGLTLTIKDQKLMRPSNLNEKPTFYLFMFG